MEKNLKEKTTETPSRRTEAPPANIITGANLLRIISIKTVFWKRLS